MRLLGEALEFELPPENPRTVRGTISLAQRYLAGEVEVDELAEAVEWLAHQIRNIHRQSAQELKAQSKVDPQLRVHLEAQIDAYEVIGDGLERLSESLPDQAEVADALTMVEEGAEILADHQQALEAWASGDVAICPKCGRRQQARERQCPDCSVLLVLPDASDFEFQSVNLGPAYIELYEACKGIAEGELVVSELLARVDALSGELAQTEFLLEQLDSGARAQLNAPAISAQLQRSLEGLERIRGFADSAALADLNRGWATVSQAGEQLARSIVPLAETLGYKPPTE
ncbi:MAG: hypothetical protein KC910_23410 [Candidatus Eremiobacteraeota bacterium]|nr:hypothetical protein [Candidatus Eremiobacteraeota bacterium]